MVDLTTVGVLFIAAGFAAVIISMLGASKDAQGRVKGGGVIMIGPIPIVFGSDMKWASIAMVLAIILIVVAFVLYWV